MYPAKWNPSNLSSIIANHPTCLDEVSPKEMKENLAKLMGGIRAAGHKFYHTPHRREDPDHPQVSEGGLAGGGPGLQNMKDSTSMY